MSQAGLPDALAPPERQQTVARRPAVGLDAFTEQQNVPRWKKHLEERTRHCSAAYSRAIRDVHDRAKEQNQRCHRCRNLKYRLDFCEFLCTPEKRENKAPYRGEDPPHRFCQDCVTELLRVQHRANIVARESDRGGQSVITDDLLIVPCPLCRTPNMLRSDTTFHEGFERQTCTKNGVMRLYSVHTGGTRLLTDNYVVEEHYENQRRPPFGSFSKENLLTTDWAGAHSTRGRTCIEDLEEYFAPPNKSWIWLENWTPDVTMGGAFGWMYANRWPTANSSEPEAGWERVISLFHLVRRRRMLKTRIRLNEAVETELKLIKEEEKERVTWNRKQ